MSRATLPDLGSDNPTSSQTLAEWGHNQGHVDERTAIDALFGFIGIESSGGVNTPSVNLAMRGRSGGGSSWDHPQSYWLTNKSGSTRAAGDVVIADSANDDAYTTTTTVDHSLFIGVVAASTGNDTSGLVITGGRVDNVAVTAATRGQYLGTSTTPGKAVGSSSPTAGTFGIALSSASGGFCNALIFPHFDRLQPSVAVQKSGSQSINNSTVTLITFDTEMLDNSGMHSTVTNTERLTVSKAGVYLACASVYWEAIAAGSVVENNIRKNGASVAYTAMTTTGNIQVFQLVSVPTQMAANDYFDLTAFHNAGSAKNINATYTMFGAYRIGP